MKVRGIKHGLYEIYWKSGGSSLSSVGYDSAGYNWIAPCNWLRVGSIDYWQEVSYIKLIATNDYSKSIKGIKGEGSKIKFTKENFKIEDDE